MTIKPELLIQRLRKEPIGALFGGLGPLDRQAADLLEKLLTENAELRDEAESWAETVEEWKDLHKLSEGRNCRMREALEEIQSKNYNISSARELARRALKESL